ncbi:hypothetical protein FISHEDRAFT_36338 [Fistulina hepatica ATCC 64428]|uniref:C3H1-type domain-containing protein n=1 Tax=Fistulina hepatica ATCC 64428 TaxID=1128425 RepID=A0A0D7AJ82_9AGAR|nr:hypothetical protein FISHEDRAFT_36338 [Fistulina hepatica ATCC 64428]
MHYLFVCPLDAASIDQRKNATQDHQPVNSFNRTNTYVNPSYKPPSRSYVRPQSSSSRSPTQERPSVPRSNSSHAKEVVIGGVAFEASSRSLVRKDGVTCFSRPHFPLISVVFKQVLVKQAPQPRPPFRSGAKNAPPHRLYKPKRSLRNRNMTLKNTRRPYQYVGNGVGSTSLTQTSRRRMTKKYSDKPCPRFTTTGSCNRGLTCSYQHDPAKIAVCWNFLQGNCPNTADSCHLSHDPTPERTPICLHFLNKGRCTRVNCPFPHVNVGPRQGVCRDFAVLGFCERGLECEHQHVRECPDFAENGTCRTKGCKLPHVIRANRNRKPPVTKTTEDGAADGEPQLFADDAQLGDEYISLTFHESESSGEDESGEEEEDDEVSGSEHDIAEIHTDDNDVMEVHV